MKKTIYSILAAFSLCFFSYAAEDDKAPVRLIVGVQGGKYSGVEFVVPNLIGNATEKDSITYKTVLKGMYNVIQHEFDDITDASDEISKITSNIYRDIEGAVDINGERLFTFESDLMIVYSYVVQFNNDAISKAVAEKFRKLQKKAQESGADSDKVEDAVNGLSELREAVKKISDGNKDAYSKAVDANNKLESYKSDMSVELKRIYEALAKLDGESDKNESTRKQIGELLFAQQKITDNIGVIENAIDKAKSLMSVGGITVIGGGFVEIPPQIASYSNQIDRVSLLLGAGGGSGIEGDTDLTGTFVSPIMYIEELPEGVEIDFADTENGDSVKRAKYLMHYLWQFGFMPWLPVEANKTIPDDGVVSALYGGENGRYFYFEKKSGSNDVITHAKNIPAPVEWVDARPWTFDSDNGVWLNAYVQLGNKSLNDKNLAGLIGKVNYVCVDVNSESMTIVDSSPTQRESNKFYFQIGELDSEGKQISGIYSTPVVFIYE